MSDFGSANGNGSFKSGSLIAGGVLAGMTVAARFAHAKETNELKVALIGCGGRGIGAISDMFTSTYPVKLWAMADMFADRLEKGYESLMKSGEDEEEQKNINAKIDVPHERCFVGFDAYKHAIDSGVDIVILATPPGFRPMHFEAAVNAGKHVFMEKPVATDAAGVRSVLASAQEAKKKKLGVGVGLQRRHDKAYIETIKRLQDGAIGDILATRVYWNGQDPWGKKRQGNNLSKKTARTDQMTEMEYQLRNWYYFVWLCGDHIVEQHIHNMDVSNWLKNGHPIKAKGMGGLEARYGKDRGEIFNHHAVEFEYADGSRMFSQCRQMANCWNLVGEHAHGSKGTASINSHVIRPRGGKEWKSDIKKAYAYRQEHQDLLHSIISGNPYNEAESGAYSTMTAILGRMCTYSGKEISWDAAINSEVTVMPEEFKMDATPPTLPGPDGYYALPMPGITKVV